MSPVAIYFNDGQKGGPPPTWGHPSIHSLSPSPFPFIDDGAPPASPFSSIPYRRRKSHQKEPLLDVRVEWEKREIIDRRRGHFGSLKGVKQDVLFPTR